jgi:adenylate cyclase
MALDAIRECFEGVTPSVVATVAADGTPNVAYLSQIQYVDREHLALSFQFFSKTRANVLANPRVLVTLMHPVTAARLHVTAEYLRTESDGPLFESMKAKLAGIASHEGMSEVFRLRGADVYRVKAVRLVFGRLPPAAPERNLLASLRTAMERFATVDGLDGVVTALLDGCEKDLAIRHAMVWLADEAAGRLTLVGSRGLAKQGVGAEVALGDGVVGMAARHRTPIRLCHVAAGSAYGRAVLEQLPPEQRQRAVPYPGLESPASQLAVPLVSGGKLRGVLSVESEQPLRFGYDDEDALVSLAAVAAAHVRDGDAPSEAPDADAPLPRAPEGPALELRHYPEDDTVFLGGEYLIKGVAGAILWLMASDHAATGKDVFSNRELRLDPRLSLPELSDNLEARLVLLQRRLAERDAGVRLEKVARGKLRLVLAQPLTLVQVR